MKKFGYFKGFDGFVGSVNEGNAEWEKKRAVVDEIIETGVRPPEEMLRKGWLYDEQNPELDYDYGVCYIKSFNYGEAVIDVTPFRDGNDEIRPRAWIDGNEIEIPESQTIKNPPGFTSKAMSPMQISLIETAALSAMNAIDEEIRKEISKKPDELDLWVFGGDGYESKHQDIQDLIEYFGRKVDWHPKLRKISRGKNMFGI